MTTRKEAIQACRRAIKAEADGIKQRRTKVRQEIRFLAWKPGCEATLAALRAVQKGQEMGDRQDAKQIREDIKALRRPETAPDRWRLRLTMPASPETRYLLLAYGVLRGRHYRTVEQKTRLDDPAFPVTNGLAKEDLATETVRHLNELDPDGNWKTQTVLGWINGNSLEAEQAAE